MSEKKFAVIGICFTIRLQNRVYPFGQAKEKDWGNMDVIMEIRKTAVLFVVISLIATAFMPLAIAQPMETNYARWTVPDTNIKLLSDDGRTAVYTMMYRYSETDTRYYHIEKRREVTADGKETGTIVVQTQDPCGSDIRGSFGKESNYTKTQKRLWIHLIPEDMEAVYSGDDGHLKFAGLFAVATGVPPVNRYSLWMISGPQQGRGTGYGRMRTIVWIFIYQRNRSPGSRS
jgi:hypothetical protein